MQKELLFRLFNYGNRKPQYFTNMCDVVDHAIRMYGTAHRSDDFWRMKTEGGEDEKLSRMMCSWMDFREIMGGLNG